MTAATQALSPHERDQITLGLLAGGLATRMQGRDKAWMQLQGLPQAQRWRERLRGQVAGCIASANRNHDLYAAQGIASHADENPGLGPIEGLRVLALHCRTTWLFTLPVDIVELPGELLPALVLASASSVGTNGAFLRDADGLQPLVALWRRDALLAAAAAAALEQDYSAQSLSRRLGLLEVQLHDSRVGNINTQEDLDAARAASP